MPIKKPSWPALLLGLIPFLAMCFTVPLWDRVDPIIIGLPFNLFWLIAWVALTPLCMWGAYRLDERGHCEDGREDGRERRPDAR